MEQGDKVHEFAPLYDPDVYSDVDRDVLEHFFTNLDDSVYVPLGMSPEVVGALCSRASRAEGDLRAVFLKEYLLPFLHAERIEGESDQEWIEKREYSEDLQAYVQFLKKHSIEDIFSNPKARSFYAKWLAQYGDDSIAQMAGAHVVFSSLSMLAIKHFEDQRIGLAPIEKSTRYVDYSNTVSGQYQYYTDPTLKGLGLEEDYRVAMDGLFATYTALIPQLSEWLMKEFPDEKPGVVEKKAFDSLRGLLPMSTLSQVAFFGNGQAFEYMISRSAGHSLGEVRWAADRAYEELSKVVPSFLRRVKDEASRETVERYQDYMAGRGERVADMVQDYVQPTREKEAEPFTVRLVEYDPDGETMVLAGIMYSAPNNAGTWEQTVEAVRRMDDVQRRKLIERYLEGRTERWQKVGRAFENTYLRYEIEMDIGAWRDLHRHRMLSQQRQNFSCDLGYVVPAEVSDAGLSDMYSAAMDRAAAAFERIAAYDRSLAQYAVPMGYRVRFMQWKNVRECFWEMELRSIPEGHPDYRHVEQEKFRLFEKAFPAIASYMRVNMGEYDFARRGQEEKIQKKLRSLERTQA